jgi:hypothetical protein
MKPHTTILNGPNYFFDGEKLWSYKTHVATFDVGRGLVEHGKWSATTSRHVRKVAKELGLTLIPYKG